MAKPSLPQAKPSIASAKVANYLLDVTHAKGGPKAHFFLSFEFAANTPEVFVEALFGHVSDDHLIRIEPSGWGTKSIFEGALRTPDMRNPRVRSIWQIQPTNPGYLDFVTAYPLARSVRFSRS